MKCSVIISTIRDGGIEWQLRYLAEQDDPPDEVIIIDRLYLFRHSTLMKLAALLPFPVIHLKERRTGYSPENNATMNMNLGLCHAKYELVITLGDWHVIPPNFITSHKKMYAMGFGGITRWLHCNYQPLCEYDEFVKLLGDNIPSEDDINHHFWSKGYDNPPEDKKAAFIAMYKEDNRIAVLKERGITDFSTIITKDIPPDWWWMNSTSAPLEYLLTVNGFDETYDSEGLYDVDLAERMSNAGLRFAYDPTTTVYHVYTKRMSDNTPLYSCARHSLINPPVISNDDFYIIEVEGILHWICKKCGKEGVVSATELLNHRKRRKAVRAPLYSNYKERTNISKERLRNGLNPFYGQT